MLKSAHFFDKSQETVINKNPIMKITKKGIIFNFFIHALKYTTFLF